ncbi:unnamed protein product [Lactuca saligna]|uniref:Myb/SANT-like domain-containing protein n=1 Tax=Lactuca saligna TaxID=75948 RepID=A0AA36EMP6_LACSI|nr:unnamed protein product [Lactuca saligna]
MERCSESKRNRVSWKNVNVAKTFLDACINEIAINGREGGSLKRMSWKKIGQTLGDNHNFSVDRKQLKNHFDYLKNKYGAWLDLKNKCGNIYDASTNTFNLTDEEWENEIKKNKYVETLRNTSLLFPDLCAQLFDGVMTNGIKSLEPISAEPITAIVVKDDEEIEIPKDTMDSLSSSSSDPPPPPVKKKQKMSKKSIDEEILGVLKIIADKMSKSETPPKPTFEECEKKLKKLGWSEDDPLHVVACAIFCEENDNYKECWMKLNPKMCANWVKMIGRSKGFI